MKILRIVFCVLACLCVAAVVPIAVFFQWYCLACVGGAFLFGGAMLLAKRFSEPKPAPVPDYMNSEEKNAEINEHRAEWKGDEGDKE